MNYYQDCERKDAEMFRKYLGHRIEILEAVEYSRHDYIGREINNHAIQYIIEMKGYFKDEHPRPSTKFHNYQIDYVKLLEVKKLAKNTNRTPLLVAFFGDGIYMWNLDKCNWETTPEWKKGDKGGGDYNGKEWDLQAYLEFSDGEFFPYEN